MIRGLRPQGGGLAAVVIGASQPPANSDHLPVAPREIEGWFWFPPDDERTFGTLTIEPRELRLKLRDSPHPQRAFREMTVLHGESLQGKALSVSGPIVFRLTQ